MRIVEEGYLFTEDEFKVIESIKNGKKYFLIPKQKQTKPKLQDYDVETLIRQGYSRQKIMDELKLNQYYFSELLKKKYGTSKFTDVKNFVFSSAASL